MSTNATKIPLSKIVKCYLYTIMETMNIVKGKKVRKLKDSIFNNVI